MQPSGGATEEAKATLVEALSGIDRGLTASREMKSAIEEVITQLEARAPLDKTPEVRRDFWKSAVEPRETARCERRRRRCASADGPKALVLRASEPAALRVAWCWSCWRRAAACCAASAPALMPCYYLLVTAIPGALRHLLANA
jgi:PAP_fibrillin